jgi:methyl-accepting chemotaxis protein
MSDPADAADLQPIIEILPKYLDLQAKGYEMVRAGQGEAYRALLRADLSTMFDTMDKAFDTLNEEKQKDMEAAKVDIHANAVATLWRTLVFSISGVLLAAVASLYFTRQQIGRPLSTMTSVMKQLIGGDIGVDVPELNRRDEIGAMSKVLASFKRAAIDKERMSGDAAAAGRLVEENRVLSEAERLRSAAQQASVVEAIAIGLAHLSAGELTFQIVTPFPSEYDKLRLDFNSAIEKLRATMTMVSSNTTAIKSGTGEISSASDDLSRRTEQQAASLEETAAALDEITATVRRTAEGSKHARELVGATKKDAEYSGGVVQQAVQAMGAIEQSSEEIGKIIGVIDEIAFQTNLLALNAGVEAARAGDAGRGFAVVASEVRALAQRSAEAAKEIKALISASNQKVGQGVDLVAQTGQALERIVRQIGEINGIVADIAASAQEQATGLDQVNTAVNQMDQVTQQNAAMVEQSTAASHALAKETDELAQLIAGFRLGSTVGAPAIRSASTAPRRASTSPSKPIAALKTLGHGGAVRKAQPSIAKNLGAHADWEEF